MQRGKNGQFAIDQLMTITHLLVNRTIRSASTQFYITSSAHMYSRYLTNDNIISLTSEDDSHQDDNREVDKTHRAHGVTADCYTE